MTINEKIKELYKKHIPQISPVSFDGVVDEEVFSQQKEKIVFLLKDPNDPNVYEDGNSYCHRDLYASAMATRATEPK